MARGLYCSLVQRNGFSCHQKATFVVGQDKPVYVCAQHLAEAVRGYRPPLSHANNPSVYVWRLDRP